MSNKENDRRARNGRGEPTVIAGLGDSLTCGWMVRRGFFDLAVDALASEARDTEIVRINAGVLGDTAPGGLRRLEAVLAARPGIVTVQFGLNDCYSGVSPAEFDAAIRLIAEAIVERGARPILVTSPPTDLLGAAAEMAPYYSAMRTLAKERAFSLADIDAAWRELPSAKASSFYLDDAVHPTDEGHAFMATVLHAALYGAIG